jgi:predicted AlkP superfamily pyrophosphatase or phosphodiesterase
MSNRVCVIDMPGLSRDLLTEIPAASALGRWISGKPPMGLTPSFPAVTCSMQATLTTGVSPASHGIIANGLPTFRFIEDQALVDASNFAEYRRQISFWEQSNQFLEAPRFWQEASGKSRWKTALLFFQNSMPGFSGKQKPAADIVLTPKPDHGPDGKLMNLCWSEPRELTGQLFAELGSFPLMNYWGPMAGIGASQWIARAAAIVWAKQTPELQWVYVPHLDYDLQRFGPESPQAKSAVHDAATALEPLVNGVLESGGKLVLLSEYAMSAVNSVVQPNLILAEEGLLLTRQTPDGRLIDFDRSSAVVMVDHQVAHVYPKDAEEIQTIHRVLEVNGVKTVFLPAPEELRHRRAGDLVLAAEPNAWFDYRWWSSAADAPGFARTVDIHRKPGYDPLELFWDRSINGISQNPALVKGSHGRSSPGQGIFIAEDLHPLRQPIPATDVAQIISEMMKEGR